jgi:hypothetical protein
MSEVETVYKTKFNVYTVKEYKDDDGTLIYIEVSNNDLRNSTTAFEIYDTMAEANEMMAMTDRKQRLLDLIESCEEEITGYYGDAVYCIADSSYEKLADVLLNNLDKFK